MHGLAHQVRGEIVMKRGMRRGGALARSALRRRLWFALVAFLAPHLTFGLVLARRCLNRRNVGTDAIGFVSKSHKYF